MTTAVERTVFATPRAAEFLELRALQAQTGQPADAFGHVVVKELLDNALDAAEAAGVPPEIAITIRTDGDLVLITVADNGPGIAPATVAGICDFNVLVSDKAKYRGPSRGAQGNAMKTILGIPYALDVDHPVVIEARGVRHELTVVVDPAGEVTVSQEQTGCDRTVGTSVTVPLPDYLAIDVHRWAYAAALVNPHAAISVSNLGYLDGDDEEVFYKPQVSGFSKWTPSMPSSAHWYDTAAFTALVYAHIAEARRGGADKPLGGFITEFDGLTSSAKAKRVRAAVAGATHLSNLDDVRIRALHEAMLAASKPPPAAGLVPKGHYERLLDDAFGVIGKRFWFKSATVTVDGLTWAIEVTVAETVEPGGLWWACNHAPSFGDPLGRTFLAAADIRVTGAASFLQASDAVTEGDRNRAAVVHVICPAVQPVDKGKVALVVPGAVATEAAKALAAATATLRKEAEQRRRDARKAEKARWRAIDDELRAERRNETDLKEAVFGVLPAAATAAGDVFSARTLFYKIRPMIQRFTSKELDYNYFSQQLLPEYEQNVAPIPGLYYKPRGTLHEPHGGQVVPLGTREVEAYTPPRWLFNKVLYIEKDGLEAQLAPYRLGERFDMAVIFGEGYSPVACRNLLARSDIRDMRLFVVHDADPHGYNIARTLSEATRRMPDHQVDVVDLGLTVPQAIDYGLETEKFTRRKDLPSELDLDDATLEWFIGTCFRAGYDKKGDPKYHYECIRCELNAFSSPGLAAFIEDGLAANGATAKLVPPDDVLTKHVNDRRDKALTDLVQRELDAIFKIGEIIRLLADEYPDLADVDETHVRARFDDDRSESWRYAAREMVGQRIDEAEGLMERLRTRLAEILREAS